MSAKPDSIQLPQFKHDCNQCVFLGHHDSDSSGHVDGKTKPGDMYYCRSPRERVLDSLILRFSDRDSDYAAVSPPSGYADPEQFWKSKWKSDLFRIAEVVGLTK